MDMNEIQSAKALIRTFVGDLDAAASGEATRAVFREHSADGLAYRGVHPFNMLTHADSVADHVWSPLKAAMSL